MIIDAERACLIVIDVQEKLCPVMPDPRLVLHNCSRLIRGAGIVDVPVLVTEQYPQGIGATMVDLRDLVPEDAIIQKMTFGAPRTPEFMHRVETVGRPLIVLCGIEAHVCVQQTALMLKERGYDVAVVADACASRTVENRDAAYQRMARHGVDIVTTEMVLFEWVGDSAAPVFKPMLNLIK